MKNWIKVPLNSTPEISDISVSNFATEGWFNIARIPDSADIKSGIFTIQAITPSGTKTEMTLFVNIAHRLDNTGSIQANITANVANSYNAYSTGENGFVIYYACIHYSGGYWYLALYKYVNTTITIRVRNISNPGWVFFTQSVTGASSIGSFQRSVHTLAGFAGSNIRANSADASTYSSYGVLGTYSRIRSNEDGSNKWQKIGDIYMAYNSSYQYGHSIDVDLLIKEVSPANITMPENLEDFKINLKANLATCLTSTAFNTTIPVFQISVTGHTALTGNDFAMFVRQSSTSTKYIAIYMRTLASKKQYEILPLNRYGKSYTSSYTHTTSYCYFNLTGGQGFEATIPTPAQGSVVYAKVQDGVKNIILPDKDSNTVVGSDNFVSGGSQEIDGYSCLAVGKAHQIYGGLGNIANGLYAYIPNDSPFRRAFNNTVFFGDYFRPNCSQFQMGNETYNFTGMDRQDFALYHESDTPLQTLNFLGYSLVGITLKVVYVVVNPNGVVERGVASINGWIDLANQNYKFDTRFRDIIFDNSLNGGAMSILDTGDINVTIPYSYCANLFIRLSGLNGYAFSMGYKDARDLDKEKFEIYFDVWVDTYELGNIPTTIAKGK